MNAVHQVDTTARRAIAVFDNYQDAQDLVDRLADRDFPVERLTIVGRDPQLVERVTGRLDVWRAMLGGATSGAAIGALFGLLFAVWFSHDGVSGVAIVLYWLVVAAAFGALFGVLAYALSGRRGFTSAPTIRAERYEVLADAEVADQAMRLLSTEPVRTRP